MSNSLNEFEVETKVANLKKVLPDHLAKPKMGRTPKFGANIVKKDDSSVSNDNDDDDVDGL